MTNKLTELTALVDISAVKTDSTLCELKSTPEVLVGGVVGFPSGGDTTASKVFQANELCQMGCDESCRRCKTFVATESDARPRSNSLWHWIKSGFVHFRRAQM